MLRLVITKKLQRGKGFKLAAVRQIAGTNLKCCPGGEKEALRQDTFRSGTRGVGRRGSKTASREKGKSGAKRDGSGPGLDTTAGSVISTKKEPTNSQRLLCGEVRETGFWSKLD